MFTTIAIAAALLATPVSSPADPLTTEIGALDAKVFDTYNRCDLSTFSDYFDPKVAFYHDTGGATFERDAMVDGVRKYICGKVMRGSKALHQSLSQQRLGAGLSAAARAGNSNS
ncbi:hypothetical protein [Sphingobium yanoikuyae]|jgi:hypothetical protein|uniref:hypothetical protein n=1 Tax=Sphingobium yanoikuyae TaxID=13690 RepID=UPI000ABC051F|nr:hypothetical protein [Sphingobium yanoikuyae]MDV3477829.1 hypothetical protein [Sphingobium yanoikuyae]